MAYDLNKLTTLSQLKMLAEKVNSDYATIESVKALETELEDIVLDVVNASTHYDFPSIGDVGTIYKAYDERTLYQWNETDLKYEVLGSSSTETQDIDLINGGNADGT